jgi:alginate O-acetyltransferase complex protein AlgJ
MDSRATSRFDRILQTCLISIFLGLISLPILGMVFHLSKPDLNEKRALTPPPTFSLARYSTTRFIEQLRSYLADNFGFRGVLVKWNARLNARTLAVSPSPSVIMGKNGWLYYAGELIIEDYRCQKPFTETELQQWTLLLERRQKWLQQRGARYIFIVAPNEHTIYPESLPSYITRLRDTSRLDQLLAYTKAHSSVPAIDLRPALFAAKAKERVYQKTDTHWNERGAFAAYQELFNTLGVWFPALQALHREQFENTTTTGPGGDLANMMGMVDVYHEEILGLRPLEPRRARMSSWSTERLMGLDSHPRQVKESEITGSRLPCLIMLHDSFGEGLMPFIAEHFSRGVYISEAMGFEESILKNEKPDLVIQEITERYLWNDYAKRYENRP